MADQANVDWWRAHLEGVSAIQLPSDYARPLTRKHVDRDEVLEPSPAVCKNIVRLALELDATPFTVVLSMCLAVLHKFSLEEDIVIGSSSSSSNAQVLRLAITGSMRFADLVRAVQEEESLVEAHDIDYAALNQLVRPAEAEEREPLCQVRFFNLVDVTDHTLELGGQADWSIFIEQMRNVKRLLPLRIRVSYNSLLFARERMQEFLAQLAFLTEAVIAQGVDAAVDSISLLTPFAKAVVPDPAAPLSAEFFGSIQSHLEKRATLHPDRALVYENNGAVSYSYQQVNELANRVANFLLSAASIKPEDVVVIFAHRSAPLVVAIMGVLKAGATVAIIDPQYPSARQITYLNVARPRALVVLKAAGVLQDEVKEHLMKTPEICAVLPGLCMDLAAMPHLQSVAATDPNVPVGPEHVSTLSFTSGSTGVPKGCRGRAISLTHFYPWMAEEFGLSENDRFTMLSGIAHDPIQRDVFTPIFFGASIYVPSQQDIAEPGRLAQWCAENRVSVTVLTPAMGQLLSADASSAIPSLKSAFFVGDVLAKRDVIRLQQLAPNCAVVNMMGSTETQRSVSYFRIPSGAALDHAKEIIPAGVGMRDVQLLVLNKNMQPCGIGEVGELFMRSHHMAKGYLSLPEDTAQKFLPNPFVPEAQRVPTDRLYRTGDVGRHLPSGLVECMGRRDDQVKIRGFRVELREIDTFLIQHPSVREAVTLLRRDIAEEHRLVAYFVPQTGTSFTLEELRAHLREKLPAYAIPSDFVPLSKMPLNPNGKIDKARLPFPDTVSSQLQKKQTDSGSGAAVELTPLQQLIHGCWKDILHRSEIGLNDSFFDLGGHSVSATMLVFQLRKRLQQSDLPLALLYDFPTIAQMSAAITRAGDATVVTDKQPVAAASAKRDLAAEVTLDESIRPAPQGHTGEKLVFFLTGATGFLGARLLHDLLVQFVGSRVHCLVRGDASRLVQNLKANLLWNDLFEPRIVAEAGDLEKPLFGLAPNVFARLARECDAVVHNGALVNWVLPYAQLRAANVGGTVEALRLASTDKTKMFVFVSSTSILDTPSYLQSDAVSEDDPLLPANGNALSTGYAQTKWVSEKLCQVALARGLPVAVVRPGYIVGNGVTQTDDFLWRLLRGCLTLGSAPLMRNRLNACSVEYVSSLAIAALKTETCKVFHTVNPELFTFDDLFQAAATYGWKLQRVEYLAWRDALQTRTLLSQDHDLYPLLHFVLDDLPTKSLAPRLDNRNAARITTSVCATMPSMLPNIFSFLVASGFLGPPTEPGAVPLPPFAHTAVLMAARRK